MPYLCITGIGWTLPAAVSVRTLPMEAPKYRSGGDALRPLSDPEVPSSSPPPPPSSSSVPQNSCIFWIIISSDASLFYYRPQITVGTRAAVVLIYDPYSSAIKRDLYGATITFTLRTGVPRVFHRRQFYCGITPRENENLDAEARVYNRRGFTRIICTRGRITSRIYYANVCMYIAETVMNYLTMHYYETRCILHAERMHFAVILRVN